MKTGAESGLKVAVGGHSWPRPSDYSQDTLSHGTRHTGSSGPGWWERKVRGRTSNGGFSGPKQCDKPQLESSTVGRLASHEGKK